MKRRILAWIMTFMIAFGTMPVNIWQVSAANGASQIGVTYGDLDETQDTAFIEVSKTFKGITEQEIPKDYTVTVNPGNYTLKESGNAANVEFTKSEDGFTWNWRINGLSTGTYNVTESNYNVPGYKCTADGIGDQVSVEAPQMTFVGEKETTCNHTDWPLPDNGFFAGTLTGNVGKGVVIVTLYSLSAAERDAIVSYLKTQKMDETPQCFFSVEEQTGTTTADTATFDLAKATVTYNKYMNTTYVSGGSGVELSATSMWKHVISGTMEYTDGKSADIAITNEYTLKTIDISGTKTWDDADNQDGKRPASITINLMADGQPAKDSNGKNITTTVTAADEWKYEFTDLPQCKVVDGKEVEIKYTITEDAVNGYTTTVSGYNVTNTYVPETTEATVKKVWNDNNNNDGKRPAELKATLSNGTEVTLNEANNWTATVTNLPVYEDGEIIEYIWTEGEMPDDYELADRTVNGTITTLTNTDTPDTVNVSGEKVWDGDADAPRTEVTIKLTGKVNGKIVAEQTTTASAESDWTWSFTDLPKYDNKQEIVYTADELNVPEGYDKSVDGTTITNTLRTGEAAVHDSITVAKVDQDGTALAGATFALYDNSECTGSPITTFTGGEFTISTDAVILADKLPAVDDEDGVTYYLKEIAAPDGYTASDEVYTIVIKAAESEAWGTVNNQTAWVTTTAYEITIDGAATATVVNELIPAELVLDVTKILEGREWKDGDSFEFTLAPTDETQKAIEAGNVVMPENTVVSINKDTADYKAAFGNIAFKKAGDYTFTVTETAGDLPGVTYDTDSRMITVHVTDDEYDGHLDVNVSDEDTDKLTFTNIYEPEQDILEGEVNLKVSKTLTGRPDDAWLDTDAFTFGLEAADETTMSAAAAGKVVMPADKEVIVTASAKEAAFGDVIFKEAGTYKFKVTEAETTISGITNDENSVREIVVNVIDDTNGNLVASVDAEQSEGLNFVNKYAAADAKVTLGATKVLQGRDLQNGEFSFKLVDENGNEIEIVTNTAEGKVNFSDLTFAEPGTYRYTISEAEGSAEGIAYDKAVHEVTVTVTDDGNGKLVAETDKTAADIVFTNVYTIRVEGTKTWADDDDQYGNRPDSITVNLLADGSKVAEQTVTADNEWKYIFDKLPVHNADGAEIVYSVTEEPVDGYVTAIDGSNITNTTAVTSVEGAKTWADSNNEYGNRPDSITINLRAKITGGGGTETVADLSQSRNVKAVDGWKYSFENLPTHYEGKEVVYSIFETKVNGYDRSYDGYDVTNTTDFTAVSGIKVWNDNNDQDGKRPQYVTINLTGMIKGQSEPVVAKSQSVTAATDWAWSFNELPVYVNGEKVTYSVTEDEVTGYTSAVTKGEKGGYTVTNTHTPEKVAVYGTKTWNDANDQDGKRPGSITINLLADGAPALDSNGEPITQVVTPDAEGNWTWSFTDLDKYKDKVQIQYSITEDKVPGYSTSYNGYNVINSYTPGKTSVSVSKTWVDNNDQDGKRPEDITVKLVANGVETDKTLVLSDGNNWTGSFTELDEYANGAEITYSVKEVSVAGYTSVIAGDADKGYTITNTHTPEVKTITGTKSWNDNNNQDGKRPAGINVILVADGANLKTQTVIPDADGNWTWEFKDLPVYKAGVVINYSVKEVPVNEYTSAATENSGILNTHAPEKTNVEVYKSWQDDSNRDGIQPASVSVKLLATVDNGDGTRTTKTVNNGVELNAGNNWHHNFTDLPKYENGKKIKYSVEEKKVPDGYTAEITNTLPNTFTVINTHEPETVDITGSKTWKDNDNQDGERPESIVINLMADGMKVDSMTIDAEDGWTWEFKKMPKYRHGAVGEEIQYTVTETAVNGYVTIYDASADKLTQNIINKNDPDKISITVSKVWKDADDQDGLRPDEVTVNLLANGKATDKTLVLKAKDNWKGTFEDLDVNADGEKIVYTIEENKVDDYNTVITGDAANGFVVTNSYTPETTNISGYKVWDDNDNNDGKRPESITINVWNGDLEVASTTVKPDAEGNWIWEFKDLPKYQNHGDLIEYTFTEDKVLGYETVVEGDKITNVHEPETVVITGEKFWNDADDQDGLRPNEIAIRIMDGETVADTVTVKASEGWKYESKVLPKYRDGKEIQYTVIEVPVTGYEAVVKGYNIENTHTPATVDIAGTKTWDDADDQDGKRSGSITVNLLADGAKIDSVTVTEADEWKYEFKDLPEFKDGAKITYTITEEPVAEYTTSYDGYDITNSYAPGKTSVTVNKVWVDGDNQDGIRPAKVKALLYADGALIDTVELTAADGWTYTWTDLDKMKAGEEITYTVRETMGENVKGYTSSVEGFTITNTHKPETTNITGTKTWNDGNDQDGIRPDSIQVQIISNIGGTEMVVDTVTVTPDAEGNWTYTSKDLPKYAGGKEIIYTVKEIPVAGYVSIVSGTDIVNTHEPEVIDISGEKEWLDAEDQDGKRPGSIKVNLLADGVKAGSMTIDAEDGWSWTFKDMPKYKDGVEIVYTITEDKTDDYSTAIDEFDITNEYTPGKTSVSVAKTWDDAGNQDGIRPNAVFVQLYADGNKVDGAVKELNASNNWSASFTGLDEYADGELIEYTVSEVTVAEGYTADIDETDSGFVITNSHKPATTEVKGVKTWNDEGDQDGKRPESLTLTLMADGTPVDTQVISGEDNWTWSFNDLPKYKAGKLITYTVTETLPEGYSEADTAEGITNSYTPEQTSVKVTKFWDDADNQDGIRPAGAAMVLLADGDSTGKLVLLNADNNWTAVVDGLDKYKDGFAVDYSFTELEVEGYTSAVKGNMADGFTVVNTHVPETVTVDGVKTWNDKDDQDGARPESIVINLLADGDKIGSATVTAENGWTWSFGDLPKYSAGKEIKYTVVEEQISNYDTTLNNVKHDVTNTHVPSKTTVTVAKKWNDSNDQDGIRPDSITVNLFADGKATGRSIKLDESNKWVGTFNDLPEYADGEKIKYTVTENAIDDYTTVITGKDTKYITITNTHEPEVIDITGTKTWIDNGGQAGNRPESIVISLLADDTVVDTVTVTAEDDWAYEFTDAAKFKDGKEITYTIEETPVAGYVSEVKGFDVINTAKAPAAAAIGGVKVLKNAELEEGQFEFGLYNEADELIGTAVNGADGTFAFEEITYSEEGTFVYFIKEMIPEDAEELEPGTYVVDGILYDTAVYKYTVTVAEEDDSYAVTSEAVQLADGDILIDCAAAEFTNENIGGGGDDEGDDPGSEEPGDKPVPPTEPEDPKDEPDVVPPEDDENGEADEDEEADKDPLTEEDKDGAVQTGDNFNLFFWMMIALAGVFGATGAVAVRRRETE